MAALVSTTLPLSDIGRSLTGRSLSQYFRNPIHHPAPFYIPSRSSQFNLHPIHTQPRIDHRPYPATWRKISKLSRRQGVASNQPSTSAPASASATTTEPPVIWFPDLSDDCAKPTKKGGFNAFGFLAFVLSAVNLLGLITSNANNNINNRNNNNNNNDNNDINSNENNGNTNQNILNQVMIAPGKRKKRDLSKPKYQNNQQHISNFISKNQTSITQILKETQTSIETPNNASDPLRLEDFASQEEIGSLAAIYMIEAWQICMITKNVSCAQRALCEANRDTRQLGETGEILAEVFSLALVHSLPEDICGKADQLIEATYHNSCEKFRYCQKALSNVNLLSMMHHLT